MIGFPLYLQYTLIFISAALISAFSIPRLIMLAKLKKLYDLPDNNRKIHKNVTPNLGGVCIFFSYLIVASLFIDLATFPKFNYIVGATLVLFIAGVKDDIITLTPNKKFISQIFAAIIIVYLADIRLTSLHGIFGIGELPEWFSVLFTIVGCVFITNAFNLIDGVDGLAGSLSTLCLLILGTCLAIQGNYSAACIAFALMGAIVGFLKHNIAPAKIFMGDSGSLVIGFTVAILSITLINNFQHGNLLAKAIHSPQGALVVALSILFVPVFDSFRVITLRLLKGKHPFHADKTHLHHFLLDLGFSHSHTTTILVTANLLIISVALFVQDYNPTLAVAAVFFATVGLVSILYFMRKKRLAHTESLRLKASQAPASNNTEAEPAKSSGQVKFNNKSIAIEPALPGTYSKTP